MTKNNGITPGGVTPRGCKRYAQAITDRILGEAIDVPKEELMAHLKECAKCRQEATNWQDFQNALRVKEYHARPEVKEKWDRFIKELTSQTLPPTTQVKVPTDAKVEIDSAAEAIYKFVKDCTGGSSDKKVAIPVIRKETGLVDYPFYEAMSWLVMNDKAVYTKDQDNRPSYVSPR